jgi:hypothetical protein
MTICPRCGDELIPEGSWFICQKEGEMYEEWTLRELLRLKNALIYQSHQIEQILGRALDYPWYKDDQKNFPGSTEADGVCVGEHVPESIALEAAHKIEELKSKIILEK